jgi:hypothetical protein
MATQHQVPGVATSYRPALAAFPNALYMAWKGKDEDEGIWWSSYEGKGWSEQQIVPGVATSVGPALAILNGRLYMAWKGATGDESLWLSRLDGETWEPQQQIPNVGSSVGPALAAYQNQLYMAWKGADGDEGIYWTTSPDGQQWAPQQKIPGVGTSTRPALGVAAAAGPGGETLYIAWKGAGNDEGIYYSWWQGDRWRSQTKIDGKGTSVGPALASSVGGGNIAMAWKGAGNDEAIYTAFLTYVDEPVWTAQERVPGVATSIGPALATSEGGLMLKPSTYMAWKGKDEDEAIWWESLHIGL